MLFRSGGGSARLRRYTRRMIRAGWRPTSHVGERMRSGGRHTLRVRSK